MVAAIPCGHPDNLEHIDEFKRESVAWQMQSDAQHVSYRS